MMNLLGMTPLIQYPLATLWAITDYAGSLIAFAPRLQAINGTPVIKECTNKAMQRGQLND
jgi:hypothetical protein